MRFRPALVLAGAAALLLLAALFPFEVRGGKPFALKPMDFLSALRARKPGPTIVSEKIVRALRLVRAVPVSRRPAVIPKLAEEAGAPVQPLELAEDAALDAFFGALHELRKSGGAVRIAYYGDSIVEGDLITQDLRASFQRDFGGSGAGFLPIASEVAPFRITVGHDFSLDWETVSLLQRKRPVPVGIAGSAFLPGCAAENGAQPPCSSWVEYKVSSRRPELKEFKSLRVFYSGAESPAALEWKADDREPVSLDLEPGDEIQEAVLKPDPPAKKLRLTFRSGKAFPVYGASWDGEGGLQVDNLAMRSNSGLPLMEIPVERLKEFDRRLGYKLIVLHFGTNVTALEQTDYSWYRIGMARVVRHFQEAFPEASVLLIGAGDRSYKAEAEYETMPTLAAVIEAQRKAAEDSGAAFWDLYGAMGGLNSMVAWVNHKPPLAALDYTHLSAAGSKRVADFLYNALMTRFRAFEDNGAR